MTARQVRAYPPRPEGDADGRRAAVRTRKDRSNPVGTNSRRDGIHDSDSEDKPRQALMGFNSTVFRIGEAGHAMSKNRAPVCFHLHIYRYRT